MLDSIIMDYSQKYNEVLSAAAEKVLILLILWTFKTLRLVDQEDDSMDSDSIAPMLFIPS